MKNMTIKYKEHIDARALNAKNTHMGLGLKFSFFIVFPLGFCFYLGSLVRDSEST